MTTIEQDNPKATDERPETVAAMDRAADDARRSIRPASRPVLTLVLLVVVAAVALFAGRKFAAPGAAPATTAAAGHDHGGGEAGTQTAGAELWTCSMHPQVIQPDPGICPICHMELTPLKAGAGSEGGITIDPVVVQNMGVRLAPVSRGPIVQAVRAVGYLEEPEPLHRDINLRVNGWIEKLYANVDGMGIEKGKPLFDLYSPELTVAVDELIAAARQTRQMPGDTTAASLVDSARRKLIRYGLEPGQIDELAKLDAAPVTIPFLAPIDGHLTAKMVYEGGAVKAGDLAMRLANRHQMWIDAQVPEQQMPLISDGQPARATLVSQPGKVFKGKVLFVHPHVDPQTRTALVRVEIENADLGLRQGMYATVEILADAYREAPLVPREAVIDTGLRQVVFVSLGEGRFASREVTLGLPGSEGRIEVVAGLNEGETVVTSGQFLLDSESRLKDAVAKHLSAGVPGHGDRAPAAPGAPGQVAEPTTAPAAVARVDVPHASDVVRAYLALSRKLGERQETDAPLDPTALIDSARSAAAHATGDAAPLATAVADAAKALSGQSLEKQREAFLPLSDAVVSLARHAKLSPDVAPTVFVMHCPMAFRNHGAHWLQDQETVANPYYATQMKRCGEVVERIELKTADATPRE